jgi:hypothetical protein
MRENKRKMTGRLVRYVRKFLGIEGSEIDM